jgi:multisubunit Na+/H+ antiporter MnhG subunit
VVNQEVVKALAGLITAAFGLVAALAWNTAIQEIFRVIFGEQSGVFAMIIYAVIVTIIAVIATIAIGRVAAKAGVREEKRADRDLEALRLELRSLKEELRKVRESEAA